MKPIDRLKELKIAALKRQYPSMPDYAIPQPKYSDTTANGLEKCIVEWLTLSGHQGERVKNTGRYIVEKGAKDEVFNRNFDKGKWIKGTGKNGTSDVHSTIGVMINGCKVGLSVKWEVKIGRDTQKSAQQEYQMTIDNSGGRYYIVKSFEDFMEKYDALIAEFEK